MKTPIEPSDIRVGDTVEREHLGVTTKLRVYANDGKHGTRYGFYTSERALIVDREGARWFLLHRPVPPVALPTEPTFGWATTTWGLTHLAHLRNGWAAPVDQDFHAHTFEFITAFTPATPVPTAALDALRAAWPYPDGAPHIFLAAVDKAAQR